MLNSSTLAEDNESRGGSREERLRTHLSDEERETGTYFLEGQTNDEGEIYTRH